jgi:pilus assembly protein FimV
VEASGDALVFAADGDEIATKLDLARAYLDMGDHEGTRNILEEVLQDGSDGQKQEAQSLLDSID